MVIVDQIIHRRGSPAGLAARQQQSHSPTRVQTLSPVKFSQDNLGFTGIPKSQHNSDPPMSPVRIQQVSTHRDPVVQKILSSSLSHLNRLRSVILNTEKIIESFVLLHTNNIASIAPNPVPRASECHTFSSLSASLNESDAIVQKVPNSQLFIPICKPQPVNYPSFRTQFNRLREKYSKPHNLNESRASTTATATPELQKITSLVY